MTTPLNNVPSFAIRRYLLENKKLEQGLQRSLNRIQEELKNNKINKPSEFIEKTINEECPNALPKDILQLKKVIGRALVKQESIIAAKKVMERKKLKQRL